MTQLRQFLGRAANSGVHRLAPPVARRLDDFAHIRRSVIPADLSSKDLASYVPVDQLDCAGIDFGLPQQIQRLEGWRSRDESLYSRLRADAAINTLCLGRNYLHNGWYPTPDAEVYASMIGDIRPTDIVEVGGGFSTRIARTAIEHFGITTRLLVVDPEPRTDIREIADSLITSPIESVDASLLPMEGERILLFIDSSHVLRARGDVQYLLNGLVPHLASGATVHLHDVYLPWDYPFLYQAKVLTEQYVLQALLSFADRYRVLFSTHHLTREHPAEMRETFGSIVGADHAHFGASLWFEVQ
jgi:Methyltransferase domain